MHFLSIEIGPNNNKPLPDAEFEARIHAKVKSIRDRINEKAICEHASELNGGQKCEIQNPPAWGHGSLMGCANYHARIRFTDDDSVWLLRVPRISSSIPQSLADYLIRSEYATLKFFETTNVPAPRVFDYGLAGDKNNKAGVTYILIEQMAGKPWNMQGPNGKRLADGKDKERVWNGLADVLIEIRRHPFSKAGSLLPGPSPLEPIVSAIATNEYYTSFVEQNMALIADGQLFNSFPVNAYLVFSFLKSQVQVLTATPNHFSPDTTEEFYIKHVDDKGDHLMVDDQLNIVGIIDWQMARMVPANEAFGPSLVTAEMSDIYNRVSSLTVHDHTLAHFLTAKGAADLGNIMSRDERIRRFFFGLDVDLPWAETLLLIRGIWAAFGVDKETEWKDWKVDMLELCSHDERLKHIISRFGEGP
ncbi:hypothetical protein PHISCL_08351 [Aspergillus sclerotialis]|uniref:Aminoglycoside phosphotransferase domain-containing protein n=1 Tax=Aspergillus sclerotialis TaxID=2070753 RepID=A0A3A2Z9N0_9EURO|nr:hypothetical protein PHISCL_08351 [Aspergillus sclerotialis]